MGVRTKQPHDELADQLKAAIDKTGLSMLKVSEGSGLRYQTVHGFLKDGRDIQLSSASKLAMWLGLELRSTRCGKPKA